jgi:hypothetical protein
MSRLDRIARAGPWARKRCRSATSSPRLSLVESLMRRILQPLASGDGRTPPALDPLAGELASQAP